jgi:hypothetical protein
MWTFCGCVIVPLMMLLAQPHPAEVQVVSAPTNTGARFLVTTKVGETPDKFPIFKYGFVDVTGKIVIDLRFDRAHDFSEGRAAVKVGDRWGFIDTDGHFIFGPRLPEVPQEGRSMRYAIVPVGDFSEGLAPVDVEGTFRFIDKTGKVMFDTGVKPLVGVELQSVGPFKNGLAHIFAGGVEGYIDRTGKWVWKRDLVSGRAVGS